MSKLTVIIPFLNEGNEVGNTVKSIRDTASNNVNILLINDCSTDDFDYESITDQYNTFYHKNEERKGVAQSRDIGVSMIQTPYFILIDGHMRFYHNNWWNVIVEKLNENDRAIYCCQCRVLDKAGEIEHDRYAYGAFIEFDGNTFGEILEASWITVEKNDSMFKIPCVLGASYAASKRYWEYIRGLSGLRYYGSDEVYISLKVWLEGGQCLLLRDLEVGHIFRSSPPYSVAMPDSMFNKLFILETVLPQNFQQIQSKLKKICPSDYYLAKSMIIKNKYDIEQHKTYYKKIFTKNIRFFKLLNKTEIENVNLKDRLSKKLRGLSQSIMCSNSSHTGLMLGEMGELIFLYEYAHYAKDQIIADFADEKMPAFLKRAVKDLTHYNFYNGAAGIGVGLNYLNKKEYIEFDVAKYFEDIEIYMEEFLINELNKGNIGFLQQALGVEYYFSQKKDYNFSRQNLILNVLDEKLTSNDLSTTVSDGINGILLFLLHIWQLGFKNENIHKYIILCVNSITKKTSEKRLIYESGDLIDAYILLKAAIVLPDNNLYGYAITRILDTCKRQDSIHEQVWDAGLIRGSSGTSLIYLLSYLYSGREELKEAASYWINDILCKNICENSTGFITYGIDENDYNTSFLHGASGIGMAMLSGLSEQPSDWVELLML